VKNLVWVLILCLLVVPVLAETGSQEAFWTEFDLTFWQTLPFAAFWGYALGGSSPVALSAALGCSVANAVFHARRVVN
jgi:hypothetical protein